MKELGQALLVVLALTAVNAFFAGAEIAVLSVRKTRLRELGAEGHRGALIALKLREDTESFLATVQVGITVVGATSGAFGGAVLEAPIADLLRRVGLGAGAEKVAFALIVVGLTVVTVVLGELVPKSLALRSAERFALLVSRPLYLLSRLARPLVWALTAASNAVLRPFRDETTFTEARLSPDELQQLVQEATASGTMNREAGEIASRAIDLGHLRAYSVMVPRREIAWLDVDASRDEVAAALTATPHARFPVRDGAEQPLGYVLTHEVYRQLLDGACALRALLREIPMFPETAAAVDVLRALQRARSEIGLLVDESGAPSGLVSIETLAEELFGEIVAEHETERPSITEAADGTVLVRGDVQLHEINRELGFDLPISEVVATLGGLVVAAHGAFAPVATKVALPGGIGAEVLETAGRRVLLVRLTRVAPQP